MNSETDRRANFIGSLWMVVAMAGFAVEDALIKIVSEALPVVQILIIFVFGGKLTKANKEKLTRSPALKAVNVAVVDRSGAAKVLLKADGSGPHTVGSITGKAFTLASVGHATVGLASYLKDHRELNGLRDMEPRLVILDFGLPIKVGDALIGGIGVDGALSGLIDEACAKVSIDAMTGK